ncbi:XRE family transcriptional regulator [Pseudomonas sp. L-22-4S-12]|uniref:S24 family peptidase n=1 Tax=Pseudomonas sp. L-22-4S-12 TaxID=2610893 RepID=UPI00132B4716|nr:S24 family peptidase [Pseudomonas sp. L-22-4S-12]MWV17537.1 XRE family transcriptional regulator [Pseudomonas sp. L-22-4S-12]
MDKNEIRRTNLQALMDREYGVAQRGAKAKLAKRLGKQADYISRCLYPPGKEGRKNIGEDFAREIEVAFKLGTYSLDSPLPAESEPSNIAPALQPTRSSREYPVISWVAAGERAHSPDVYSPGVAEEWLASTENAGPHGYWLIVKGPSMTSQTPPSFPDGTPILIRPEGFDLVSGKFYIARHRDGETTFKQYIYDSGREYLVPLNKDFRQVEMDHEWDVIGRVIDVKAPKGVL